VARERRQPPRPRSRRHDRRPGRRGHGRLLGQHRERVHGAQLGPQLDELATLTERYDQPPGGQRVGWHQYFDLDMRRLLGMEIEAPFHNRYCGNGKLKACQQAIWNALAQSGTELTAKYGTADPAAWRADATAERIEFAPGLLTTTMRYTNRPTGIQQVISFNGHR
jgi:hypothetical protein